MLRKTNAPPWVSKHEGAAVLIPRDARARPNLRTRLRMRAPQAEDGDRVEVLFTFQTAHLVPAAHLCARVFVLASQPRMKGWRSAEITCGCCGTRGACLAARPGRV